MHLHGHAHRESLHHDVFHGHVLHDLHLRGHAHREWLHHDVFHCHVLHDLHLRDHVHREWLHHDVLHDLHLRDQYDQKLIGFHQVKHQNDRGYRYALLPLLPMK